MDIFNPMEAGRTRGGPHVGGQSGTDEIRPHAHGTAGDERQRLGLQNPIGYASAWAVEQISGEPIGEIKPIVERQLDWFLTPRK